MAPQLDQLLAALDVTRRPGRYSYLPGLAPAALATVLEPEGPCAVVEDPDGAWAWLTCGVASDLEAVGLTAALSGALAASGIACNVLAGLHHDHLLVPADRADDALTCLGELSAASRAG